MKLLKIALLAGMCALAAANVALFRKCNKSSKMCTVKELQISPCRDGSVCRITRGQHASVDLDFTPYFYTKKLKGIVYLGDSDVRLGSENACYFTNCPTQYGQKQRLSIQGPVGDDILSGKFEIRVEIFNPDNENEEFCCFKTTVEV